jgi:hypothetical protein
MLAESETNSFVATGLLSGQNPENIFDSMVL